MLYNNPVAYKTDFLPEQIAELAGSTPTSHAVKESSADVRRVTAIRALCGDRLELLVGVDDVVVEGVRAGAVGWIAGLVNAFPRESVALYNAAMQGRTQKADELYAGSCRCCAWTRSPSSCSSSSWCNRRPAWATSACVRPGWCSRRGAQDGARHTEGRARESSACVAPFGA